MSDNEGAYVIDIQREMQRVFSLRMDLLTNMMWMKDSILCFIA